MKRRHFFGSLALGVAGFSVIGSCKSSGDGNNAAIQNGDIKYPLEYTKRL